MQITYKVALEVATHEAVIRRAYKDSVGVWTWSVGLTNATGHDVTRYIDNPASLERCLEIYVWALKRYANQVREVFDGVELTEEQFAAALSFHWNTGGIKRASWVKHWKAGRLVEARRTFMNWKSPPEIVGRRAKERDLFFYGKWSNDGTMTEYTRLTRGYSPVWRSAVKVDVREALKAALGIDEADESLLDHEPDPDAEVYAPTLTPDVHKPAETPVSTVASRPEGKGGIATGVGGLGTVLTETASQVQPLIPYADTMRWVFLALMLAGIAWTAWALIQRERDDE